MSSSTYRAWVGEVFSQMVCERTLIFISIECSLPGPSNVTVETLSHNNVYSTCNRYPGHPSPDEKLLSYPHQSGTVSFRGIF